MSDLVIRTLLDDSGLTQQVKGLHRKFQTAFRAVKAVAIPAAAIGGAVALAEKMSDMARAAADSIKPIGDQARALGISAERFQELRILTDQAGGSTELLDTALFKLSDTLGKLSTDAGARIEKRLTSVGVSLRDNQGRVVGVGEAWDRLSEKISSGALTQEQAVGAATAAFGEQGAKLIQVLSTAREEQQRIIREAHKLGAIIPDDAVRNASEYSDKLALIGQGTKALQDQRNLALAPLAIEWEKIKNEIAQATVSWSQFLGIIDRGMGTVELEFEIQRINDELVRQQDLLTNGTRAQQRFARIQLDKLTQERAQHQERLEMLRQEAEARERTAEAGAGLIDTEALAKEAETATEILAGRLEALAYFREQEQLQLEQDLQFMTDRLAAKLEIMQQERDAERELADAIIFERERVRNLSMEQDAELFDFERQQVERRRALAMDAISNLESFSGKLSAHSKKMFKLNKIAAIAEAAVNMQKGISEGVALGWPKGIPAVAWAALNGAAAIAAIKKTEFGGGTTPSAAGTPTVGGFPVEAGLQQTLRVEGISADSIFGGADVRRLAQRLLDFQRDGGRVVLVE